jgi:hypothetical protein
MLLFYESIEGTSFELERMPTGLRPNSIKKRQKINGAMGSIKNKGDPFHDSIISRHLLRYLESFITTKFRKPLLLKLGCLKKMKLRIIENLNFSHPVRILEDQTRIAGVGYPKLLLEGMRRHIVEKKVHVDQASVGNRVTTVRTIESFFIGMHKRHNARIKFVLDTKGKNFRNSITDEIQLWDFVQAENKNGFHITN